MEKMPTDDTYSDTPSPIRWLTESLNLGVTYPHLISTVFPGYEGCEVVEMNVCVVGNILGNSGDRIVSVVQGKCLSQSRQVTKVFSRPRSCQDDRVRFHQRGGRIAFNERVREDGKVGPVRIEHLFDKGEVPTTHQHVIPTP